jgi:DnaD/phage-associated family protein
MARKRFITSDISTDKKIAILAEENPTAALMWPWIITNLDDWGRMGADPVEVKLTVFPAFPFTSKDIAKAISLYDEYGLAHYYEVDGKPYLAVNPDAYYKYQTYINKTRKEKDESKIPAPPNPPWNKNTAKYCNNQQTSANIVLSLSHSLSDDDDNARAREEKNQKWPGQYERSFALTLNSFVRDKFQEFADAMGDDVVCEAIKRAKDEKARSPNRYCETILANWLSQGVRSLVDIKKLDEKWKGVKSHEQKDRGDPGKTKGKFADRIPTYTDD